MPSPSLGVGHRGFAPFPVFLPCGRIATCLGTPFKSGETACTLATYGLWQPMALPRKNVGPSWNGHRSWCLSSRSECLAVYCQRDGLEARDKPLHSCMGFMTANFSNPSGSLRSRSEEHTSELQSQSNLV